MVTVPALKAFEYQGRQIRPGEDVTMASIDAAVHARLGHVGLLGERYLRRDMTAAPPDAPEAAVADPSAVPVKAKRQYRRRNLTAVRA